jgi:hypothetical protein
MLLIKGVIQKYFRQYDQSMQHILSIKDLETILLNAIIFKMNKLRM